MLVNGIKENNFMVLILVNGKNDPTVSYKYWYMVEGK